MPEQIVDTLFAEVQHLWGVMPDDEQDGETAKAIQRRDVLDCTPALQRLG